MEDQQVKRQKTRGEEIVRIDFNASGSDLVSTIKTKHAELIDLVNSIPQTTRNAAENVKDAEKYIALSSMLAVKAATEGL